MKIRNAEFTRLGYSGNETFAEVEVTGDWSGVPVIATFKQENGRLKLVNVAEKRADLESDWFDNNLHEAYPSAAEKLGGDETLRKLERVLLSMDRLREEMEDAFYYGNQFS